MALKFTPLKLILKFKFINQLFRYFVQQFLNQILFPCLVFEFQHFIK